MAKYYMHLVAYLILGCFIFSTFLKLNTFGLICDGILDTDSNGKFFAIMTSFRGGTAGSKSAGDRNLKICHNSATEGIERQNWCQNVQKGRFPIPF